MIKNTIVVVGIVLSLSLVGAASVSFMHTDQATVSSTTGLPHIRWTNNTKTAFARSKATGTPMFIFFHADWCSWCKKMEDTTFKNDKVVELINSRFVPLSLDVNQPLAKKLGIKTIPFVMMTDPTGKHVITVDGYRNSNTMLRYINAYLGDSAVN